MIGEDVFKGRFPLFDKLLQFGFVFANGVYVYLCKIVDGQFNLKVWVTLDGKVRTSVIDPDTEEEYTLHLSESAVGKFVGQVRTDYACILQKIADDCFEKKIFQSEYAEKIIRYICEKYQDDFEYLWEKFPNNAIVRRKDNKKWYALLLTVEKSKLGLQGNEKIEIIDLRSKPEEIECLVDGKKYFLGYHMNKKHWITLCLDGSVDLREIFERIDQSYCLAKA